MEDGLEEYKQHYKYRCASLTPGTALGPVYTDSYMYFRGFKAFMYFICCFLKTGYKLGIIFLTFQKRTVVPKVAQSSLTRFG